MHTVSDQNLGLVQPDSEMLGKTKCAICRYNRYIYIYIIRDTTCWERKTFA